MFHSLLFLISTFHLPSEVAIDPIQSNVLTNFQTALFTLILNAGVQICHCDNCNFGLLFIQRCVFLIFPGYMLSSLFCSVVCVSYVDHVISTNLKTYLA